jgi:hypothetical protein
MKKETSPLNLRIDEEIWNEFKDRIPRSITLNDAVVDLIKKFLGRD